MAMLFGREDTIRCLQDVALRDPGGRELCLAHDFSVVNDGQIRELQATDQLPTPLPPYSISCSTRFRATPSG